jgi:NitT/TauT family transport system permease protein
MGFLLSVAIGVPLGILAGSFKPLEAIIAPICEFIRYMPVPAFVRLSWCGTESERRLRSRLYFWDVFSSWC